MTPDIFSAGEGNTPLTPEEQLDLIPSLGTKHELNEWERENILTARLWAMAEKGFPARDPLTESYVRDLHRRMFNETWKWAGRYRTTDRNIGIAHYLIRDFIARLLEDVRYWIANETYSPDEIAIRFHHRLVWIHPFPNGNGRHTRLLADVLLKRLGQPHFTWGFADITKISNVRERYIAALKAADRHDIEPLLLFARS